MIYGKPGHKWVADKEGKQILIPIGEDLDELDEVLDEELDVTYEELKARARTLGIKGYGSMKPETLINRIKELSAV